MRRIENLTWPDGSSVEETDEFNSAVNNYRAGTCLLTPGEVWNAEAMDTNRRNG